MLKDDGTKFLALLRSIVESGIQEFENTIKELNDKKDTSFNKVATCKEKDLYYKELSKVFNFSCNLKK